MDSFQILLYSISSSLSDTEVYDLKLLCRDKIGKRKLESVEKGMELFIILLEQQLITKHDVSLLKNMFEVIKRKDLVLQLEHFVEEEEAGAADDQPDADEKPIEAICENVGREWKMLMRRLGLSEVKLDRIIAANPCNLREQLVQSLREWQRWKGKDAKVADLIKALRDCKMNLVAD
ncbi:FADD protein, partial [Penelope pileata]|nr:FADD protein [Penelope pileata]